LPAKVPTGKVSGETTRFKKRTVDVGLRVQRGLEGEGQERRFLENSQKTKEEEEEGRNLRVDRMTEWGPSSGIATGTTKENGD